MFNLALLGFDQSAGRIVHNRKSPGWLFGRGVKEYDGCIYGSRFALNLRNVWRAKAELELNWDATC